ncbi:LolA-related protein [Pseudomonas sp. NPDC007930]|uniref:outer membrane lipoprotein carrier protein LolA n=1 Tax=Pseudomonas sp. NPDC007930 TaxID=3364417 RepID=UPI0036E7D949
MKRLFALLCLALAGLPCSAQALSLDELAAQLGKPAAVRGPFVQEKYLRSLPQPLTSRGEFVLARDHGLLWLLQTPLRQDYRIDDNGLWRRDANGWQALPAKTAGAEQNRLFFAVLRGDATALNKDFELSLQGDLAHWQVQLTPRSLLLKQVFSHIDLQGGQYVEQIELFETQGDRTLLRLPASTGSDALSATEQQAFAH